MKNLLIIDLESTCYAKGEEPPGFVSEIIEIGAVVFDPNKLSGIDEYQCFVKPVRFPQLSNFCCELTSIRQEQVDHGLLFEEAIKEIGKYYSLHQAVFCSWGNYDKNQFFKTCQRLSVVYPFGRSHISLKHEHGLFYGKKRMGMKQALVFHGLPLEGTHHRGIDDARNIAKIAAQMIRDGWRHKDLVV